MTFPVTWVSCFKRQVPPSPNLHLSAYGSWSLASFPSVFFLLCPSSEEAASASPFPLSPALLSLFPSITPFCYILPNAHLMNSIPKLHLHGKSACLPPTVITHISRGTYHDRVTINHNNDYLHKLEKSPNIFMGSILMEYIVSEHLSSSSLCALIKIKWLSPN